MYLYIFMSSNVQPCVVGFHETGSVVGLRGGIIRLLRFYGGLGSRRDDVAAKCEIMSTLPHDRVIL